MNSEQGARDRSENKIDSLATSIVNASIDGLVALDTDLNISVWNNTAAAWSGRDANAVLGRPLYDAFPEAREVEGLEIVLQNALRGFKSVLPASPAFYLPGHYEVHIVPLRDDTGQVTGVVQILHDIAHRIKAENELKSLNQTLLRQNAELEMAHEELAAFSKITAHDLKEPLRKIYTFAELIMMREAGKLSNSGRSHFRRIQKGVQRMGLITDDLVNFSDLSRSAPLQEVDLNELLSAELEHFRNEIAQTGAVVEADLLPAVSGYPAALTQLLRQLLSNALKFHKPGEPPQVRLACEKVDHSPGDENGRHEHGYYHLTVTDRGIGFEPQYQTLVFGLFQRLHPEGTYRGSGMGLAIAQKAARLHEGFLSAESTPGNGSTFHCYLPVR